MGRWLILTKLLEVLIFVAVALVYTTARNLELNPKSQTEQSQLQILALATQGIPGRPLPFLNKLKRQDGGVGLVRCTERIDCDPSGEIDCVCYVVGTSTLTRYHWENSYETTAASTLLRTSTEWQGQHITTTEAVSTPWVFKTVAKTTAIMTPIAEARARGIEYIEDDGAGALRPRATAVSTFNGISEETTSTSNTFTQINFATLTTSVRATATPSNTFVADYDTAASSTASNIPTVIAEAPSDGLTYAQRTGLIVGASIGGGLVLAFLVALLLIIRAQMQNKAALGALEWEHEGGGHIPPNHHASEGYISSETGNVKRDFFAFLLPKRTSSSPTPPRSSNTPTRPTAALLSAQNVETRCSSSDRADFQPPMTPAQFDIPPPTFSPIRSFSSSMPALSAPPAAASSPESKFSSPQTTTPPKFQIKRKAVPSRSSSASLPPVTSRASMSSVGMTYYDGTVAPAQGRQSPENVPDERRRYTVDPTMGFARTPGVYTPAVNVPRGPRNRATLTGGYIPYRMEYGAVGQPELKTREP
ncbi:hypothetical protein RUND412_010209 [Rhizina undulata]